MSTVKTPDLALCDTPQVSPSRLVNTSMSLLSWQLTPRQLCDVELILNGAFDPLGGFLSRQNYESVLNTLRLSTGELWPIPITLDVSDTFAEQVAPNDTIALSDPEGVVVATMVITDQWRPDKHYEAIKVFGSDDCLHPGVDYLYNQAGPVYLGGTLQPVTRPTHYDFQHLRLSPSETKNTFKQLGWKKIVGFQTRNPMHRAHQELTLSAAIEHDAKLLIHPVVGMTKPGDVDYFTRVRCYEHILKTYPKKMAMLSLLPLAMRMAGPREALWHALIRKNYGCTHFIIGRDHAGPGNNKQGKPFYDAYAAQDLVAQFAQEIGINIIPFKEMVYVEDTKHYMPIDQVPPKARALRISGTEFRQRLYDGKAIPDWFSYPDVVSELRKTHPPKHQRGFTLFFTGLSGAGKSTLANALITQLLTLSSRPITLLDGDVVRQNLSSELGFSEAHRNLNIQRIGYVASEITRHRGIAVCAPIAPYTQTRKQVRQMIEQYGGFIEIYVSTPLEVCEQRDRKGLYAKARQGIIKSFTGIDDPYQAPENCELTIDTSQLGVIDAVQKIIRKLISLGYLTQQ